MIRIILLPLFILFCCTSVKADIYIDFVTVKGQQVVVVESNGKTYTIPITKEEMQNEDTIVKKVCSVINKCKDRLYN